MAAVKRVGLIQFDTFTMSDVADFLALLGVPASRINNLSRVPVNGGATLGQNQHEVLLDINAVLTVAPGAKVVVYDAPFTGAGTSFQALFNAAINGGSTVISNSWATVKIRPRSPMSRALMRSCSRLQRLALVSLMVRRYW